MVSDIRLLSNTVDLIGTHVDISDSNQANHTIRFTPAEARAALGDGGKSGQLDLMDASGRVLASLAAGRPNNAGTARAVFDGSNGNLTLGGAGADGDLILNDSTGEQRVWVSGSAQPKPAETRAYIDGGRAQVELGGAGADGDVVLRRADGRLAIGLNAETAAGHFGARGQEGDVLVYDAAYEKAVHLDGKTGAVEAKRVDVSGTITTSGGVVSRGAVAVLGENGLTEASLSARDGAAALTFGAGASEVTGHAMRIEQQLSATDSLLGKPQVFVGDMQWERATADAGDDPEASVRAMLTTEGLCRLGGNGRQGALEITGGDGAVGLSASDTRLSLANRFVVGDEGDVTLTNGQVSVTQLDPRDPGSITIDRQAVRVRADASGGFVLLHNENGPITISLDANAGTVEAQDIKLPQIASLLAKIDELETRLAALEAGA